MTAPAVLPGTVERAGRGALAGTGQLVRLVLRRDRVALAVWILIMGGLPAGLSQAVVQAYPTEADRTSFAAGALGNTAEIATRGPVFGASVGGLTTWTIASSGVLLTGVVSLLLVVRHTRAEEQSGRRELVGAGVLGRHAALAAALAVVAAGNLVIAVLVTAGLAAVGLPAAGSAALGLTLAAGGLLFAAVGAVAAQLAQAAGATTGIGLGVLGASFAVAAAGEVSRSGLVWASPFGWARRVQAFAGDRWAVFTLFLVVTAVLVAVAAAVSQRRDLGAGIVPTRPGPAVAGPGLRGPLSLAWRLQRGAILSWTAGFALLGLLLGAAMSSIGNQLDTAGFRAVTATLGGGDPAEAFFRIVLYVLSQVVAAAGLTAVLALRGQETGGLADMLLATPVGRLRWALGHVTTAAAGVPAALAGLGLAAGIGRGTPFSEVGTTLAYLPACLVFGGLAVMLLGWAPRLAAPVTWSVLGLVLVIDLLGEFRLVGDRVLGLSPFVRTLTAMITGSGLSGTLLAVALVAVALTGVGLAGLVRRDLG